MDPLSLSHETIKIYMDRLTPRQAEIIGYIASGMTDKEIAPLLSIRTRTLRHHISNARRKIGAENRLQLVAVFVAWRYLSLTPDKKSV